MTVSGQLREGVPRVVVGSGLLAGTTAAAALLAGSGSLPWTASPWLARAIGSLSAALVLVGGVAVAAVLFGFVRLALARRRAGSDAPQPTSTQAPASRWQPAIWAVVALAVLSAPLMIFWLLPRTSIRQPPLTAPAVPSQAASDPITPALSSPPARIGSEVEPSLWPALAGLALLAVAVIVFARVRRRAVAAAALPGRPSPGSTGAGPRPSQPSAELPAEPRAAVVACYRAMEDALAERDLTRRYSETPTDLILRAAADHAPLARAGARLCRLYDEARFSEHPLGSAQRQDAVDALAAVQAALREPS